MTFRSALVPPYVRKTRSLEAALPWLYLKGVSTGEMASALSVLVGPEAKGLSASTVAHLKQQWSEDYQAWRKSRLDKDRWVYLWADGIYSGLRAEHAFDQFERLFEAKYPKAVQCLQKDRDELMAFYALPAQHWQSLRTANPIEPCSAINARHAFRAHRAAACVGCREKSHPGQHLSRPAP